MKISLYNFQKGFIAAAYYAALFNSVFIVYGIKYLYLLLNAIVIILMFSGGLKKSTLEYFYIHMLYIVSLIIMLGITMILLEGSSDAIIAFGVYTLPILMWISIYSNRSLIKYPDIFTMTLFISGLVGYLGVIQFFFNPTLWGFIPLNSNQLIWAEGKTFIEYAFFFRASSVVGSPQVLALFCALTLIITLKNRNIIDKWLFYLTIIGLFGGGLVSGGKLFFLLFFLYVTFTQIQRIRYILMSILTIIGLLILINLSGIKILEIFPSIERVFSIEAIIEQEKNDSRIDKYKSIIKETNPFYGNGLGKITNKSVEGIGASESYLLKLYYEAGFLVLLIFLVICLLSFFGYFKNSKIDAYIVLLAMLGMMIVHAFESPVFLIIWGHLLGGVMHPNKNNEYKYI